MTDTLLHAYGPLLAWPSLGFLLLFVLPDAFPRFLGRSLYWVGMPLEIFALARQTPITQEAGLSPIFTIGALLGGIPIAWFIVRQLYHFSQNNSSQSHSSQSSTEKGIDAKASEQDDLSPTISPIDDNISTDRAGTDQAVTASQNTTLTIVDERLPDFLKESPDVRWQNPACRGSFILSSVIGNTGFVGLAIAPLFVSDEYLGWIVFYSVTHNVVGTYGIGVFLASYYGRSQEVASRWTQLRDVLTVPSLWAFLIGTFTRSIPFPTIIERGLHGSVAVVIPCALMLMGMRLSQIRGWNSLKLGLIPAALKSMVVPLLVGAVAVLIGLSPEPRLALVIMAGMPTAFAGLILAEEYELDRELITGSIVLSSVLLLVMIPIWLVLFGDRFVSL